MSGNKFSIEANLYICINKSYKQLILPFLIKLSQLAGNAWTWGKHKICYTYVVQPPFYKVPVYRFNYEYLWSRQPYSHNHARLPSSCLPSWFVCRLPQRFLGYTISQLLPVKHSITLTLWFKYRFLEYWVSLIFDY